MVYFQTEGFNGPFYWKWTHEGNKFVLRETVEADADSQPVIRVVENWHVKFRDRE